MNKSRIEQILNLREINKDEPLYLYFNDAENFISAAYKMETYKNLDEQLLLKLSEARVNGSTPDLLPLNMLSRNPLYKTDIPAFNSFTIKDKKGSYTTGTSEEMFKIVTDYPDYFESEDISYLMENLYMTGFKRKADVLYNIIQGRKETEGLNLYQMKNDIILNNKIFFDEREWGEGTNLNILYFEKDEVVLINISGDLENSVALDEESFLDISEKNFVNLINQTRFYAQEEENEKEY